LAVAELSDVPSRTVAWLPAGMVAAVAARNEAMVSARTTDLQNLIRIPLLCVLRAIPACRTNQQL
jgi:hypothetical protein